MNHPNDTENSVAATRKTFRLNLKSRLVNP